MRFLEEIDALFRQARRGAAIDAAETPATKISDPAKLRGSRMRYPEDASPNAPTHLVFYSNTQ